MITEVAIVPGALALLPSYAGSADVLAGLRSACLEVVDDVVTDADRIVLITATDRAPRHTRPSIGQRVGAVLLDGRSHRCVEIDWDATVPECVARGRELVEEFGERGRTAIVIVADGSACRSLKAPGHLDERSFAVDESWASAVRRADAGALAALDPELSADLLFHGRAPLQVLAGVLAATGERADEEAGAGTGIPPAHWLCVSMEESDPFGVQYVVARLARH